jgi:hypothetical protein
MSKSNYLVTSGLIPSLGSPNGLHVKMQPFGNIQYNSLFKFSKWSPFQTIPFVNFRSISFLKCFPNCLHFKLLPFGYFDLNNSWNDLEMFSMSKCNLLVTSSTIPSLSSPNCLHFKLYHLSNSDLSLSRNVFQIVSKLSPFQKATNYLLFQFNSHFKFSNWSPFQTIPFVKFRSISFLKCSPNCLHFKILPFGYSVLNNSWNDLKMFSMSKCNLLVTSSTIPSLSSPNGLHFKLYHLSNSDLSHSRNVFRIVFKLSLCQKATNYLLLQFNSRFKFSNWSSFQTRPLSISDLSHSRNVFTNCLQIVSISKCNQLFTSPV